MADTVRTQTYLTDTLFPDGQAANAITEQDVRDFVVSVPSLTGSGWANYNGTNYTSGVPLSISAGVRTPIAINGSGGATDTTNLDEAIWNTSTNKITPTLAGSAYDLRIIAKSAYASGSSAYVDLDIDIGGAVGVIYTETKNHVKGTGTTINFTWSVPIFAASTFVANGGTINLTPSNAQTFWDIDLFVVRTFRPAQ